MQLVLRIWLLVTAGIVASALIWSFAPILVPVIALTAGIGGLVAGIVRLARRIEQRKPAPPLE